MWIVMSFTFIHSIHASITWLTKKLEQGCFLFDLFIYFFLD